MKKTLFLIILTSIFLLFCPALKSQNDTVAGNRDSMINIEPDTAHSLITLPENALPIPEMNTITLPFQPGYEWISYRMKVNMELDNNKRSVQLFFVNRIDSIIYLNLHIAGIELARLVMTPQEITFVNKLEQEYYQGDPHFLGELLGIPIDFYIFQSLFNGMDFKDFESNPAIVENETEVRLVYPQRCHILNNYCIEQILTLNNSHLIRQNHISLQNINHALLINYDRYSLTDSTSFFNTMTIQLPHLKNFKAEAELKNLKFNTPGPTGIKIPNSFTPMDIMPIKPE